MTNKKSIISFFRAILFLSNIGVAIWLLLCLIAAYYNPDTTPHVLSLFSFTCLFASVANISFVFFWLFSRHKSRLFLSLTTLIVSWNTIVHPTFGLNFFSKPLTAHDEIGLKVLSWNVHLFDLGGWTEDETSKGRIIELIQKEDPDVLCLQEFYLDVEDPSEPYITLIQKTGYPFVFFSPEYKVNKSRITSKAKKGQQIEIGSIVFSKYPLRNSKTYMLQEPRHTLLSTEIIVDSNKIFTLNAVHLTSVGFGLKEMGIITEVKEKGLDYENKKENSRWVLSKLMKASADRSLLANRIDSVKREMDYPIILVGDFNDMPGSYVYTKTKGRLADAFAKKGAGLGRTYRHIFPTLRIDYILYDQEHLQAEAFRILDVELSDHYPLVAYFSFK